jgi:hypothetical protein
LSSIFKITRLLKGFLILSTQKGLIPEEIIESLPKAIRAFLKFLIKKNNYNLSESLQKLGPYMDKNGTILVYKA